MFSLKLTTVLLLGATLFTSTLANPAGTVEIAAAKLDAEVGSSILAGEPNRCCTPGCEFCSVVLCEDVGCRDAMYTSCCNYELRSPAQPKTIS